MTADEIDDALDQADKIDAAVEEEPRERRPVGLFIVAGLLLLGLCGAGVVAVAMVTGAALPGLSEGGGDTIPTVEATPVPPTPEPPTPTASPAPPTDTPTPVPPRGNFPALLDDGTLTLDGVEPTGLAITGTGVLTVRVTNTSDQPVDVTIPPGYVFTPPGGVDEQRMMVLQSASASIPPGQSGTLDPYVACIDEHKEAPSSGTAYGAGDMVEDQDLLALSLCLDGLDLPALDFAAAMAGSGGDMEDMMEVMMSEPVISFFSLQYAIWQVAGDYSADSVPSDSVQAEAMQNAFGGEYFTALAEHSEAWLAQCELEQ